MTRASAARPSDPPRSRPALTHVLVLAGLGVLLIGLLDCLNFTVDDSFISLRYAENFAAGKGLVFNAGERVEGYSNLLWTLVLGVLAKEGVNQHASPLRLLIAAKVLGLAFAIATLIVLAWLIYGIRRDREWGDHTDLIGLAALCTSTTYSFSVWSVSGLETSMCAFFVTLGGALMVAALRDFRETARSPLRLFMAAGVTFGVLTLVRPEQFFVWVLAFAVFLGVAPRPLRTALAGSASVTLLIYAASLAWRWTYYGALIPNSVTSKSGGGLFTVMLGLKYAFGGVASILGIVALGFLGLGRLLRGRTDWQFLAIYCGAYTLFVFVSGGDWMPGFRFFVPVLPLLWVLGIASLLAFTSSAQPRVSPVAVGALVLALAVSSFSLGRALVRAQLEFPTGFKGIQWQASPTRIVVAREIGRIVPPGSLLAIFEAGYVPYFNPNLRILDLSGLMDRTIARLPGRHMYKVSPDYFLKRAPDYYLMMVRVGTPSAEGIALLATPEFRARYEAIKRFDSLELALAQPNTKGERPLEEDLGFVLYRRKS